MRSPQSAHSQYPQSAQCALNSVQPKPLYYQTSAQVSRTYLQRQHLLSPIKGITDPYIWENLQWFGS